MSAEFSLPAGLEWTIIIFMGALFLTLPVFAIIFYLKNKELKKEIEVLTEEKNDLLNSILIGDNKR